MLRLPSIKNESLREFSSIFSNRFKRYCSQNGWQFEHLYKYVRVLNNFYVSS